MDWEIKIPTKVGKKIKKLPKAAQAALLLLIRDLEKMVQPQVDAGKIMAS